MANPYHGPDGKFTSRDKAVSAYDTAIQTALMAENFDAAVVLTEAKEDMLKQGKAWEQEQATSVKEFFNGEEPAQVKEAPQSDATVKYSFKKDFEEQVETFNKNFDGYPSRFFNADLRGKVLPDEGARHHDAVVARYYAPELMKRMTTATSSPADFTTPAEEVANMAERLNLQNFQEITDPATLTALGITHGYYAAHFDEEGNGRQIVIANEALNSKNYGVYSFRRRAAYPPIETGNFIMIDTRNIAGADRILRKTGDNLTDTLMGKWRAGDVAEARQATFNTLQKLEEAQFEGRNFKQQQKYFRENTGSIATARDDKKNPLPTHEKAAKETPLRKYFSKVELDNDVDLEEFKTFEKDYAAIADKLPQVPTNKQPVFRVRYLGKHKADGIYFPSENTVAVDIRNGGSAVHELLHQYDIAVKSNASLSQEFRGITKSYSNDLKMPPELASSKREYYTTPTEILARGGEYYFAEKLGIKNNRLLDVTKLGGFDYAPFRENGELREKVFQFFDNFLKN